MAAKKSDDKAPDPFAVDLFGAPADQLKDRWGRPSFAKTKENQQAVASLAMAGWTQQRIARFMRCDVKTLRKHFSQELQAGGDMIEGEAVLVLVNRMRAGRVDAARRVMELAQAGRAVPPRPGAQPH